MPARLWRCHQFGEAAHSSTKLSAKQADDAVRKKSQCANRSR
jgi:hypothetical protein